MFLTTDFRPSRTPALDRPWLICMDLQREYVVPGRPLYAPAAGAVAQACCRVLATARARGWRILHTQLRGSGDLFGNKSLFGAPIEGLRPLVTESVFLRRGLSAFSNPDFAQHMREALGQDVYLIGFSLADTGLATALAAVDQGLSLTLVEDAIGAGPSRCGQPAAEIARAILSPYVSFVDSQTIDDHATAMLEYE